MPKLDLSLLGSCIRNARKECGLTQKELANQTGSSVKTIQDVEKGRKSPSYKNTKRDWCPGWGYLLIPHFSSKLPLRAKK